MPELGEIVILASPRGKRHLFILEEDKSLHTEDGRLLSADIMETPFGGLVKSHLGRSYRLIRPTILDLIKGIKRQTQILYPKEIGYICLKLGIGPGCRVIEAGSGSGSLTMALSWFAGSQGQIYTYERRPEFSELCKRNLERASLGKNVQLFQSDIEEGFLQNDVDALFLDVRTPWEYLAQASKALAKGAPIGFLLPTTNQVSELLRHLEQADFTDPEVMEIMIRRYKPVPDRLRPEDRMVGHTGFLVFARQQDRASSGDAEEKICQPTKYHGDDI